MKAVVFVDVQKDFIDGALKNDKAIEVTPKIVGFAKECMKNGYKLYATRDTHHPTIWKIIDDNGNKIPLRGYATTLEGKKLPVQHCIEGLPGWMIDERLMEVLDGNCTFINKHTFGSFDLAEIIAEDDIRWTNMHNHLAGGHHNLKNTVLEEIVICGFCTSICVAANAILLRAKFPNIKITIMKDLCACVTEESHNAALKVLEMQQIDII